MRKTITLIILSAFLFLICPATTVMADSDWVPNWTNEPLADTYYYNGEWHKNPPSKPGVTYIYNGQTYVSGEGNQATPAAKPEQSQQSPTTTQRPSAYVDNAANAKAGELVDYAMQNGVAGSYVDSTNSQTVAQKHIEFIGRSGSFDMTLTTYVGSDGNYVTKYWRSGAEKTLVEIQGMILGCR